MQDMTKSRAQAEKLLDKQAEQAKAKRPQGHGRAERGLDAVAYHPEGLAGSAACSPNSPVPVSAIRCRRSRRS